jgi:hypothetical protein
MTTVFKDYGMAIPVVQFSRQGYKIRKVLGKKLTNPKEIIRILQIVVVGRCQTVPKFDLQSRFST